MIITIFALGYFILKLIDLVVPSPQPVTANWIFKMITVILVIVLIFFVHYGLIYTQ